MAEVQVQPFLEENVLREEKTYLLLSKTRSELNNAPQIARCIHVTKQIGNRFLMG